MINKLINNICTSIDGGWDHALCCTSNGNMYSCGYGYEGNKPVLGHGDKNMRLVPTQIDYFSSKNIKINKVCCGYDHSMCITRNGDIYAWGGAQNGQLGIGIRSY